MTPEEQADELVTLKPIVMQDAPEACQTWLTIGCQSFTVGMAWETTEEGLWFKQQLVGAIAAALRAQLAAVTAERDTAQNELCTAEDQIPPDLEGESLSVVLLTLTDARRRLTQERDELAEALRVHSSCDVARRLEKIDSLQQQLATVTAENERLTQLQEKNEGRVKAIVDEHLQQELARCREVLKDIAEMSQDDLKVQLKTGDSLKIIASLSALFNNCRDQAKQAREETR